MQITEVLLARVVLFADVRLLNPSGLSLRPIHDGLLERYNFMVPPTEFDFTKGIRYGGGEFEFEGKTISVGINIFTDGWVVDTLVSTEACEAFWNDIAGWVTTLGFQNASELVKNKTYESQLVFKSNLDLSKSFEKLHPLAKMVAEVSGNSTEQISGFYVGVDGGRLSTFTIERREGVPFSENKYFSRAGLSTSKHILVLNEAEKMLG